jgi:hypothetical protein
MILPCKRPETLSHYCQKPTLVRIGFQLAFIGTCYRQCTTLEGVSIPETPGQSPSFSFLRSWDCVAVHELHSNHRANCINDNSYPMPDHYMLWLYPVWHALNHYILWSALQCTLYRLCTLVAYRTGRNSLKR